VTFTTPTLTQTCPSANPDATGDFLFLILPSPKKGGGVGWGLAVAAAKFRSCRSSSSARQGKRNKYNYEVECVTDVPIDSILNR
jgi:hypothetical protein